MIGGETSPADVAGGVVGNDRRSGGHDGAEKGLEVAEFQSGRGILLVKGTRLLIPANVRDGMGLQIRLAIGRPKHFADKPILTRRRLQQVGQHLIEGLSGIGSDKKLSLDAHDGFQLGVGLAQQLLRPLALGDVLPGSQDADDLPRGIVHGNLVRLDPDGSAVGQRRRLNDAKLRRIGTHHLAVLGDEDVRLLARQCREVAIVFADNLLGDFESKGTSDHAIAPQIPGLPVLPEHPLRDVVQDHPEHVLRVAQRFLGSHPLDGDAGQMSRKSNGLEFVLGRRLRLRVVDPERAHHFAGGGHDRIGPARAQPGASGQVAVGSPVGMCFDVLDDDALVREGRRATGTNRWANLQAVDRLVVEVRQTRCGPVKEMTARLVEQQNRTTRLW